MTNEELKNILELSGSIVNVYSNLSGSYLATIAGDINKSYLFNIENSEHIIYNISNANTNNDNKIDGTYYYVGIYDSNGFPYFQNKYGYTIYMTTNWGWTLARELRQAPIYNISGNLEPYPPISRMEYFKSRR